jgi:hypothetical protein
MKLLKQLLILAVFATISCSARAESTIYLFETCKYVLLDSVTFNGDEIALVKRPFEKMYVGLLPYYSKGVTKCTIKNDGRILIVRDFTHAQKPYHDEMTLDLNDGDVYYIEMVSGMASKIKLLKQKDGEKLLKKAMSDKEWVVKDDTVYEN